MIYLLSITLIVAFVSSFVLFLLKKWGFVEWLQINGNDFFSRMAWCDFCLSWWVCVIITAMLFIATRDTWLFFVPFCSTMLTRKML